MLPGPPLQAKFPAWYAGTDTLYPGYAMCFNADYGTAATADKERLGRVEKPASGNLHNFAGLVQQERGARPLKGPCAVHLVQPTNSLAEAYTTESCTYSATLLSVVAGSYKLGGIGEGVVVGIARQTYDRSSTNGLILMELWGVSQADKIRLSKMGVPTASSNVASSALWESCPWDAIGNDPGMGMRFFDDFLNFGLSGTITTEIALPGTPYNAFGSSGATILPENATTGSSAIVLTEATDDESVSIRSAQAPWVIDALTKALWFEARLKVATITNTHGNVFVGLMENVAGSATVPITAGGTIADENFVGWQLLEGDGDKWQGAYKADGQTIGTPALSIGVPVAAAYCNVGFMFSGGSAGTLTYFYNGVRMDAATTAYSVTATILASATFPDDIGLGLRFGVTEGASSSDQTATMDWWRIAQLR